MADIKTYINQIKNAIYGKDVRTSIVDAIEKINNDNETYQTLADDATTALKQANAIVAGKVGIDDTNVGLGTTYSSRKIVDTLNDSLTPLQGTSIKVTGTDLNNYTTTGIYYFTSGYVPLNVPAGVNGWLQVLAASNTTVKQVWYRFGTMDTNDSNTYVRTLNGTTWSAWTLFATKKELDDGLAPLKGGNVSTVDTDLNNYTTTGIYYFPSGYVPINIPIGVNGFLVVLNNQGNVTKQIWYRLGTLNASDHQTYIRTGSTGNWSDWTKIITQKDLDTVETRLTKLEAAVVALGGTI